MVETRLQSVKDQEVKPLRNELTDLGICIDQVEAVLSLAVAALHQGDIDNGTIAEALDAALNPLRLANELINRLEVDERTTSPARRLPKKKPIANRKVARR